MKPTPEQIITWAHDAGMTPISHVSTADVICNAMSIVTFAILAYEAGRKDENEAAIEDARTVGGETGAEMEKLIRARREQ